MIIIQYSSQQGTAPTWPWALVGGLRILKEESGRLHQHSSPSQSTGDRRGDRGGGGEEKGDRESNVEKNEGQMLKLSLEGVLCSTKK